MFGLEKLFSRKAESVSVKADSGRKYFRINVQYCASPMIVCLNSGRSFKVVDSNLKKVYPIGRVIELRELEMSLLANGVGVAVLPNDRLIKGSAWKKGL